MQNLCKQQQAWRLITLVLILWAGGVNLKYGR